MGIIYRSLKKPNLALKEYNTALYAQPKNSTYLNNKGNILREIGLLDKAIEAYKLALNFNPRNIRYWCNLAKVLNENHNFQDAKTAASKALEINSESIEALNNLGLALEHQKQSQKAIEAYEKALFIDPQNAILNNNIGRLYFNINETQLAIKFTKFSIRLNPSLVEPYYNLCEIYDKTNKLNKFSEFLTTIPTAIKNDPSIQLKKGQLELRTKKYKECIRTLDRINIKQLEESKVTICHEILGKSFDQIRDYDTAFLNFTRMNTTASNIAKKNKISFKSYRNRVDNLTKIFTQQPYRIRDDSEIQIDLSPTFIVGFPRSGTTLLDTVLRTHSCIEVIEEVPLIDRIVSIINKPLSPKTISELSSNDLLDLRKIYKTELRKNCVSFDGGKVIVDKFPLNIIHAPLIVTLFPSSKFILVLRHPFDCVLSCFMQNFELNEAMVNFLTLKDASKLYSSVMTLWSLYSSKFKLDVETIKYEHLISNFQQTTTKVLNFIGLEWDDKLLEFYKTGRSRNKIMTPSYSQVTEHLYNHAEGRWKNYSDKFKENANFLEQWLTHYSYDN